MVTKEQDKQLAMQIVDIMKEMSEEWRVEFLLMIINKYEDELKKAEPLMNKKPMNDEELMKFANQIF